MVSFGHRDAGAIITTPLSVIVPVHTWKVMLVISMHEIVNNLLLRVAVAIYAAWTYSGRVADGMYPIANASNSFLMIHL